LLTGDALYCDSGFCQDVLRRGGQYLLIVKKNQSTLYEDIEYLFTEPPIGETFGYAESRGRHGDRHEVRRCWVSGALSEYLAWPGLRQVGKVERLTTRRGKESRQVRYFVTSLDAQADPESILEHVRGHWGIENRLHYVRDVTLGEDASQVRSRSAPEVMAALRNCTISLLRHAGWPNIAAALRHHAWLPNATTRTLGLAT
jgi:predicted transposase YbfD/YdcC